MTDKSLIADMEWASNHNMRDRVPSFIISVSLNSAIYFILTMHMCTQDGCPIYPMIVWHIGENECYA